MTKLAHHIDLHERSVQQGYNLALMHIKLAHMLHRKSVRIITGRSGKMNREAKGWFTNPAFKPYVKNFYHDFHKGAWFIELSERTVRC